MITGSPYGETNAGAGSGDSWSLKRLPSFPPAFEERMGRPHEDERHRRSKGVAARRGHRNQDHHHADRRTDDLLAGKCPDIEYFERGEAELVPLAVGMPVEQREHDEERDKPKPVDR